MRLDPSVREERADVELSIVIITENEEDRVAECIESVIQACQTVQSFELILVDSASTDRTLERAQEYPITILRIPEEHTISCGAGRYVGGHVATGDLVLHVDGDMVLTEEWLPRAIDYIRGGMAVAVEGCLDESTQSGVQSVDKVGGVMLYDAAALRSVGGFDPYLSGYEDIDVGYQLKRAGYELVRLPEVSAFHRHDTSLSEPFRRWRQGYYAAPGQVIRKHLTSPEMLWRMLRRQRYKLGLLAWLSLGLLALFSVGFFVGWITLSAVGFAVLARRLGLKRAGRFLLTKSLGLGGLAVGLLEPTPDRSQYPLSAVEVVVWGESLTGAAVASEH